MKKLLKGLNRAALIVLFVLVTIVTRIVYVISVTVVYTWFIIMNLVAGHESALRWMIATLDKMR